MKKCIGMAALIAVAGASASAQQVMQTQSFGPDTPNYEQVLTFDLFDVDINDVESIKVKFELNIDGGSLTVDNDGLDAAVVDVELGATGALSSTDVTLLNGAFQPVAEDVEIGTTDTFNLAANDGDDDQSFDPNGGLDEDTLSGAGQSGMSMGFINSTFWADFIGASGTFDILADVDQILDFGGVGGVSGGFTPVSASGNVMIIVTIPAPASAGALAIGALAFGRRRR